MSISEQLTELQTTKTDIKKAIEGQGQDLTDVPFTQYADKIRAIQSGSGGSTKEQEYLEYITTLLIRDTTKKIELTIPNEVTELGVGALYGWAWGDGGLYEVDLNNVIKLYANVLYGCSNLSKLTASNLKHASSDSLRDCKSLISLDFPLLESVETNAFRGCENLEKIDFSSLKSIQGTSFNACSKLKTLIIRTNSVCFLGNKFPSGATFLYGGTASIYVPDELVGPYKLATNWADYADMIKPLSEYT